MVGRPKLNEPTTQKQKPEPLTMYKRQHRPTAFAGAYTNRCTQRETPSQPDASIRSKLRAYILVLFQGMNEMPL